MVNVVTQGLDNYAKKGIYAVVEGIYGEDSIKRSEIDDLDDPCEDVTLYFRTKLEGLSHCTCHLTSNNVAVVTVLSDKSDVGHLGNEATFTISDSFTDIENKIKKVMNLHKKVMNEARPSQCLYCKMLKVLTPEEKKVVLLMNKGLSSVMISTLLNKNIKTVSSYKRSIMRKIGVRSNVQLYRYLSTISVDH